MFNKINKKKNMILIFELFSNMKIYLMNILSMTCNFFLFGINKSF